MEHRPGWLGSEDGASIAQLRRALDAAGYSDAGLRQAFGAELSTLNWRRQAPWYLRRFSAPTPLNTLIRLFLLHAPVTEEELRAALPGFDSARLAALGLVNAGQDGIRSPISLAAHDGLLFAHDPRTDSDARLAQDHVLGVTISSLTLAFLTVRSPARLALDLGTGCGIQALLAARHSEHVIATDTNARALNYTAFNARLNGMDNVECRQGHLFEPVAGCQFDLIVSNPPYVISPDNEFIYRDSGLPGDTVSREMVRQTPAYLAEGGIATVMCNWAHYAAGEEWSLPVRGWIEGNGCDALLLLAETLDPPAYAVAWNQRTDPAVYGELMDRWLGYYERLGITAISAGSVVLRRRATRASQVVAEQLPDGRLDPTGEQIERVLHALDYLAGASDEVLLDTIFRLPEEHRVDQRLAYQGAEYVIEEMEVRLPAGLRFHGRIDSYTLHILAGCDGQHRLGEVIAQLAERAQIDPGVLAREAVDIIRQLLMRGFLIP